MTFQCLLIAPLLILCLLTTKYKMVDVQLFVTAALRSVCILHCSFFLQDDFLDDSESAKLSQMLDDIPALPADLDRYAISSTVLR